MKKFYTFIFILLFLTFNFNEFSKSYNFFILETNKLFAFKFPLLKKNNNSLNKTISENSQLNKLAFNTYTLISGDFSTLTFIPSYMFSDYFGFQYLRDSDASKNGNNSAYVIKVASRVLNILNSDQKKILTELTKDELRDIQKLARLRITIIKAFYLLFSQNETVSGKSLNKNAVKNFTGKMYELDAKISVFKTEAFAKIYSTLTTEQKNAFESMKYADSPSWPEVKDDNIINKELSGKSSSFKNTYISFLCDLYSMIYGSSEADSYFNPDRQSFYFGGFYEYKMAEQQNKDSFSSTSYYENKANDVLKILNFKQKEIFFNLIDNQIDSLRAIVKTRKSLSYEFRKILYGEKIDTSKIYKLACLYGELDGEISCSDLLAFLKINQTLTPDQRQKIFNLRDTKDDKTVLYYILTEPVKSDTETFKTDRFFK